MTGATKRPATVWPARLTKDGKAILCGWTDIRTGRQTCDGVLALGPFPGESGRILLFPDFYEPADQAGWARAWRAKGGIFLAAEGPLPVTTLRIGEYAAKKIERGQMPRRRYHAGDDLERSSFLWRMGDGTTESARPWPLPVILPCLHGHANRIDVTTVRIDEPTPSGVK